MCLMGLTQTLGPVQVSSAGDVAGVRTCEGLDRLRSGADVARAAVEAEMVTQIETYQTLLTENLTRAERQQVEQMVTRERAYFLKQLRAIEAQFEVDRLALLEKC